MGKLDEEIERIRIEKVRLAYDLADMVLEILNTPQAKALDHYKAMMAIARKIKG